MKFIEDQRTHIPAQTDFIQRKFLDIQYAEGSERRQLDIYLPNEGEGPFPVIIDIFGGGWFFGNKSSHKLEPALAALRRGYAVVSINYSLSYQARFPVQIDEVKAAIRYIKANADQYQIDRNKVALFGESAGAHYAALCATSSAAGALEDKSWGNHEYSSEVQAVIAVFCPTNIGIFKEQFAVLGATPTFSEVGEADSMEGVLFGYRRPKDVPELVALADPCSYVNEKCPPFLFLHGSDDQCVPYLQSMMLATKIMEKTSIDNVEYHLFPGRRHYTPDFANEEMYQIEVNFLDKVFR